MEYRSVVCSVGILVILVTRCHGASLGMDRDVSMDKDDTQTTGPSVHHFARHGLCKDIVGKIRFFNAISEHLCGVSENLKVSLVLDLCSREDYMLDGWVAEIYDIDRDGFISHSERTFYKD